MAKKKSRKQGPPYYGAKIKCNNCGTVVQSASVHDFAVCKCWMESRNKRKPTGIAIDGGGFYCKMSFCEGTTYEIVDSGNYKDE